MMAGAEPDGAAERCDVRREITRAVTRRGAIRIAVASFVSAKAWMDSGR